MATSIHAARTTLKSNMEGVAGGGYTLAAGRVTLGYKPLEPKNDFFKDLASDDAYLLILPGSQEDQDVKTKFRSFGVPAILYLGLARETADDFTNPETLVEAINTKLIASGKRTMTWEKPVIDDRRDPMTVTYDLEFKIHDAC